MLWGGASTLGIHDASSACVAMFLAIWVFVELGLRQPIIKMAPPRNSSKKRNQCAAACSMYSRTLCVPPTLASELYTFTTPLLIRRSSWVR